MGINKKQERIGEERYNNQGYLMRIVEYNNNMDIIVEFQDIHKERVHAIYKDFKNGKVRNGSYRIGEEKTNNQGCRMKIIEYNNYNDIVVEFQDKYKAKVRTRYGEFTKGSVKNPYHPSVCGIGITGNKYKVSINHNDTKEYKVWIDMLKRCFDKKEKKKKANLQRCNLLRGMAII